MTDQPKSNLGLLVGILIISIVVSGYFTGIQAPMTMDVNGWGPTTPSTSTQEIVDNDVIPATHYSQLPAAMFGPNKEYRTTLSMLKSKPVVPEEEILIGPEQKLVALAKREQNRAYNGAPPTIPHPIDQVSDASCVACHAEGVNADSIRIPKMSHAFMSNCTQCHVERKPAHFPVAQARQNYFVGLPAPQRGPRAFSGAPPQIPHSEWMRSDCSSCHGPTGEFGIRTTHPWRQNCQQCHAPSLELNQVPIDSTPKFLPPPVVQ